MRLFSLGQGCSLRFFSHSGRIPMPENQYLLLESPVDGTARQRRIRFPLKDPICQVVQCQEAAIYGSTCCHRHTIVDDPTTLRHHPKHGARWWRDQVYRKIKRTPAVVNANFQEAVLEKFHAFEKKSVRDTNFVKAKLFKSRFNGTKFERCDFSGANLRLCDFPQALFEDCDFYSVKFNDCDLNGAKIYNLAIEDTVIEQTCTMRNTRLEGIEIKNSRIEHADLSSATLHDVQFIDCTLAGLDLSHSNLRRIRICGGKIDALRVTKYQLKRLISFDGGLSKERKKKIELVRERITVHERARRIACELNRILLLLEPHKMLALLLNAIGLAILISLLVSGVLGLWGYPLKVGETWLTASVITFIIVAIMALPYWKAVKRRYSCLSGYKR